MPVLINNPYVQVPIPVGLLINFALTGVVSALDTYSGGYPPEGANNGDRKGLNWGAGGGWNSVGLPSWLQVVFGKKRQISKVDVFTVQDAYASPSEPDLGMTFTLYGIVDFEIQYWDPVALTYVAVPGGIVTGNNKVWRQFIFASVETTRIRVYVTNGSGYARITELEAWGN